MRCAVLRPCNRLTDKPQSFRVLNQHVYANRLTVMSTGTRVAIVDENAALLEQHKAPREGPTHVATAVSATLGPPTKVRCVERSQDP